MNSKSVPLVSREDLDSAICQSPACDHTAHEGLLLHSRCHPESAVQCEYKQGVLNVTCAQCASVITRIVVADGIEATRCVYLKNEDERLMFIAGQISGVTSGLNAGELDRVATRTSCDFSRKCILALAAFRREIGDAMSKLT